MEPRVVRRGLEPLPQQGFAVAFTALLAVEVGEIDERGCVGRIEPQRAAIRGFGSSEVAAHRGQPAEIEPGLRPICHVFLDGAVFGKDGLQARRGAAHQDVGGLDAYAAHGIGEKRRGQPQARLRIGRLDRRERSQADERIGIAETRKDGTAFHGFACHGSGTESGVIPSGRLSSPAVLHQVLPFVDSPLLNAGVLDRAEGGGIIFPFEAVKVEFMLHAA
jgi:hypothetical protein